VIRAIARSDQEF